MAGSTTSACAAVSVMNCSSTTVNRSSRRSPSSTRSWSGAIDAGFEFQQTSALTGGSSAGSVSAAPSWDMLIVRTGPGRRSSPLERVRAHRGRGGGGDVRAAAAPVAPGAGQRRQRGDRRVGGRGAQVALGADAQPEQRGPGGRELAPDAGDGLGVDAADLRAALDRVLGQHAPAARRSRRRARGTSPRRAARRPRPPASSRSPARRRCPGSGRRCSSATRAVRLRNGSTTTSRAPARARLEQLAPQVRRGGHRVPAPHEQVAGVGPLLGVDLRRDAVRRRAARDPAVAQIVRSSAVAPSAFITRALIVSPWIRPCVPM